MQAIELTIQYNADDLQKAYQLHYRKGYPVRSRLLLIVGLVSLLLGCALLAYSYYRMAFSNWFAWFLVIYGLLVVIFYFWRIRTMGRRMFRRMPDFKQPYHYTFSEQGIRAESALVNSDNHWGYYVRYLISDEMILLYPNKYRFNFFARDYFTEEQFETLKKWVKEKIIIS